MDPVSHSADTIKWRVQQFLFIMRVLENSDAPNIQLLTPQHSISQSQFSFARTLRKANFFDEAADELNT